MATLSVQRVNTLPGTPVASTLYIVKATDASLAELYFTSADGLETRRVINKADIAAMISAAAPTSVAQLTTARSITITGDASWTVNFDGSGNVSGIMTLANSGVTAGQYTKVTVDAKGRVTAGASLAASDIPNLDAAKITSGTLTVGTSGNAATATKLATARTINGVSFDGSANITINAVDSTARIASSEKGAANGVATLDASGLVPSAQLPSYVDDVLEYTNLAGFPGTGATGKIYVDLATNKTYRWSGTVYIEISASPGSTDSVTEGSVNKYFTEARVLATVLSGLSTATNAVISATDTVLGALGKLQAQITGHTGRTDNPHSVTAAQVGAMATTHAANAITGLGTSGTATTVARSDHTHTSLTLVASDW